MSPDPPPFEVPPEPSLAALKTTGALAFVAIGVFGKLVADDPRGEITFWVCVPLFGLAAVLHGLRWLSGRPRVRFDATGVYLNPPGALLAWDAIEVAGRRMVPMRWPMRPRPYLGFWMRPGSRPAFDGDLPGRVHGLLGNLTGSKRFWLDLASLGEAADHAQRSLVLHAERHAPWILSDELRNGPPAS